MTEEVGLDVHTLDARSTAGSSKRRGSLRQWLEVMRRRRGKEDAAAWSSTSVLKPAALYLARVAPRARESTKGVERVRERLRGAQVAPNRGEERAEACGMEEDVRR